MARPKSKPQTEVKRVQMDMPLKSLERLKALQVATESSSYSEVMRNALRLYEAIIEEIESGSKIMIEKNDKIYPYNIFYR